MPASHHTGSRRKVCPRYVVLDELLQAGAALTVADLLIRLTRRQCFVSHFAIRAALREIPLTFKKIQLERTTIRAGKSRAEAYRATFVQVEKKILEE